MRTSEKLKEYFTRFPGIGPRQAERFLYFLLSQPPAWRTELALLLQELEAEVAACTRCFRFYQKTDYNEGKPLCSICQHPERTNTIMVVTTSAEIKHIERVGAYRGRYFVLGGLKPVGAAKQHTPFRERELMALLSEMRPDEVIFALPATAEGDYTATWLAARIAAAIPHLANRITMLGRGLSTGTEITYADPATLSAALSHREALSLPEDTHPSRTEAHRP